MPYNLKYFSDNGNSINFSPLHGLAISHADGLTSVNVDMSMSQGINQVGKTIAGKSVQNKSIIITGTILGLSRHWRKHLIDTIVPDIPGKLVYNDKMFLDVEIRSSPEISAHTHGATFQFILEAGHPYWRAFIQSSMMLSGLKAMFRFPINYSNPPTHRFSERVLEGHRNVINTGNVPVPFRVMFRAVTPVLNPFVKNVETLERVGMGQGGEDKLMEAGEIVIIDMIREPMSVTSTNAAGVTSDDFARFDISSTIPFLLKQGDNLLMQDAEDGRENLECTIFFHSSFAGAFGDDDTWE